MSIIKRFSIFLVLASSSMVQAIVMEDEGRKSIRAYMDSVHVEEPSSTRSQRYGGSLEYKSPLPFRLGRQVERRLGYGLSLNIDPDFTKKSGEVNVLEDMYALNAFLEANYVLLFRFSALLGAGTLLSVTKSNVLNTKDTHSELSGVALAGLGIDYAITKTWEFGWHFQVQYRPVEEKLDWRHGFGLIFNF